MNGVASLESPHRKDIEFPGLNGSLSFCDYVRQRVLSLRGSYRFLKYRVCRSALFLAIILKQYSDNFGGQSGRSLVIGSGVSD